MKTRSKKEQQIMKNTIELWRTILRSQEGEKDERCVTVDRRGRRWSKYGIIKQDIN